VLARQEDRFPAIAELGVECIRCDVADAADTEAALARVGSRGDGLDLLVNAAAIVRNRTRAESSAVYVSTKGGVDAFTRALASGWDRRAGA
jgi:NAD(P)-dependent dehydrogenase (short-subunit alcohol dehydrogenase family)